MGGLGLGALATVHCFFLARKWMVTGIGLGVIPFIVHPIDK